MSWPVGGTWLLSAAVLIVTSVVLIGCTDDTLEPPATPPPTATPTLTPTPAPTFTPTSTPTLTPTPVPTLTPTPTPTLTPTPAPTFTPVPPPTLTPTPTPTPIVEDPEDEYYTQFLTFKGVTIKGNDAIDPMAFQSAADMIGPMLSGRQDIAECADEVDMELAIIPKDERITTLPEFRFLEGRTTHDGRSYESVRGGGAVRGRPITVTSEESLLGLKENGYRYIALVTIHEFAHSIQNLCFTAEDHSEWEAFYDSALQDNLYPGAYLMTNSMEFFAVFSTAYFEVTAELGPNTSRNLVETKYPEIFEFLDEIYGGAELSAESKRLTPR